MRLNIAMVIPVRIGAALGKATAVRTAGSDVLNNWPTRSRHPEKDVEILDNEHRRTGDEEDSGEEEHLDVAIEFTEDASGDFIWKQPEGNQVDTDRTENQSPRNAEIAEDKSKPKRNHAHSEIGAEGAVGIGVPEPSSTHR